MAASLFGGLFPTGAGSSGVGKASASDDDVEAGGNLLDEWRAYEGDAAKTTSSPASARGKMDAGMTSSGDAKKADGGGGGVGDLSATAGTMIGSITGGLGGILRTTSQTLGDVSEALPSRTMVTAATVLACFGGFQLMLAVFVFLPMIVIAPQKFALSFTGGSACLFVASLLLRGWKSQLKQMISKERLPFTCSYVFSIIATVYASLIVHSYFLSVIFSFVQVVCLSYYMVSYLPGGTAGLSTLLTLMSSVVKTTFSAIFTRK